MRKEGGSKHGTAKFKEDDISEVARLKEHRISTKTKEADDEEGWKGSVIIKGGSKGKSKKVNNF